MLDGMSKVGIKLVAATRIRVSGAIGNNFGEKLSHQLERWACGSTLRMGQQWISSLWIGHQWGNIVEENSWSHRILRIVIAK